MALDSMMASFEAVTRIGDLPNCWILRSSGGARCVFGSRTWRTRLYGIESSSRSQSMRWDWEFYGRKEWLVRTLEEEWRNARGGVH